MSPLETHVSNYPSGLPIDLRTYTCTDTARVPYIPVHCHYVIDTLSPTFAKGLLRAGCSLSPIPPLGVLSSSCRLWLAHVVPHKPSSKWTPEWQKGSDDVKGPAVARTIS